MTGAYTAEKCSSAGEADPRLLAENEESSREAMVNKRDGREKQQPTVLCHEGEKLDKVASADERDAMQTVPTESGASRGDIRGHRRTDTR